MQDKIKTLAELGDLTQALRNKRLLPRKIVQAHGVFDLLHPGHMRHLKTAAEQGDILIVTITADAFVNKGPGRPIFPEALRAEMVAALECVDYVGINHAPSGDTAIDVIKPDIFVKGSDYKGEDITGKIVIERNAVEAYGGKVVFTDDIMFSSSGLINRYMNIYDPDLQRYLAEMRKNNSLPRLLELLEKIKDYKVVLIGDTIIDEYNYVTPLGKASKESILATLYKRTERFSGGVLATANHLASFCKEVEVITVFGSDHEQYEFEKSLKTNIKLTALINNSAPTVCKSRDVDENTFRKLHEMYFMDSSPITGELSSKLKNAIAHACANTDMIMVNDFGHGMIHGELIDEFYKPNKFLAVNAQTNAGNYGFNLITKYPTAHYVCLDDIEARLVMRSKYEDIGETIQRMFFEKLYFSAIAVTQGKKGSVGMTLDFALANVPALTNTVTDTMGAGDAFFALTAPLVKAGATMAEVCFLGNAAGALKVGIVGHRESVERIPLFKFIQAVLK